MSLTFHKVHKSFGGARALRGVSFTVAEGACHACVGENGAGKSTLLKILGGLFQPDSGEISWRGERLRLGSPREAIARGIGLVHQEMQLFPNLSVAANIFAGREITTRAGRLDDSAMRERTRDVLGRLRVAISPETRMERLSPAHCQLVQVARALAFDCHLLVLDEPTASLTAAESAHLFDVLEELSSRGVTLLFVSHRIPEVLKLCDRITVLRDGEHVGTFDRDAVSENDIVSALVGRRTPERVPRGPVEIAGVPALSIRHLTRRPRIHDVSLDVYRGEIVGLFGLVGSGRSALLTTVFGLARPGAGTIAMNGQRLASGSPRGATRAGLALVPEERQRQGLFFNLGLRDNLVLPRAALRMGARIRRRDEQRAAEADLNDFGVKFKTATEAAAAGGIDRTPDTLSGGNQQKIVLAKWLRTNPSVLLLDEPTKGVDVGAKFDIHNLVRRQTLHGMACLVASSDLQEVLALSDRIVVMREGRIQGELPAGQATEERVMRLAASATRVSA